MDNRSNSADHTGPQPSASVRPRPAVFRALGHAEPPALVTIQGQIFSRVRIFKHDSWAATALYEHAELGRAICKFNRRQSIGPVPMKWLGRILARNESRVLERLKDTCLVPVLMGNVTVDGQVHNTAIARKFVEGHPLGHKEQVHPDFFPRLRALLDTMHQRGMAYVDLHKRENVLVGDDGQPYLIDFQISYVNFAGFLGRLPSSKLILTVLQRSDDYHLEKLRRKSLPPEQAAQLQIKRPWWIRVHRGVAMPYRQMRRKMFVMLKVRSGQGRVHSEHFTEEALRDEVGRG